MPAPAAAEFGREDPDETWIPAGLRWDEAQPVVVDLADNRFDPEQMTFVRNQPYQLVLRNVGERPHDLVDLDFYHSIVIKAIISPSGTIRTAHVHSISVQPGAETKVYFVAVKPGNFDIICSIPGHREDGMEGRLSVK